MYKRKGNKRTIYIEGGSWACVYNTASISALVSKRFWKLLAATAREEAGEVRQYFSLVLGRAVRVDGRFQQGPLSAR